jgi:hypothetical protein
MGLLYINFTYLFFFINLKILNIRYDFFNSRETNRLKKFLFKNYKCEFKFYNVSIQLSLMQKKNSQQAKSKGCNWNLKRLRQ